MTPLLARIVISISCLLYWAWAAATGKVSATPPRTPAMKARREALITRSGIGIAPSLCSETNGDGETNRSRNPELPGDRAERGSADGAGAVTRESPSEGNETAQSNYVGVLLKPPKARDRQLRDAWT